MDKRYMSNILPCQAYYIVAIMSVCTFSYTMGKLGVKIVFYLQNLVIYGKKISENQPRCSFARRIRKIHFHSLNLKTNDFRQKKKNYVF